MKSKSRIWLISFALLGVLMLAACGGGGGGGGGLQLGSAGEGLAFDKTELTAKAGDIKITFKNNSSGQQHNFVVVKGGDDVAAEVDEAGAAAGPPNYLPTGDPNVAGATQMLAGGASETLSLNLPAGSYTYLCTFPGHFGAGMKGVLTVN